MTVVWTVGELALVATIGIFVVIILIGLIVGSIIRLFQKLFMKDCYRCKYYYLKDVASAGDLHWMGCKMFKEYRDAHKSSDEEYFRFCKMFVDKTSDTIDANTTKTEDAEIDK